MHLFGISTKAIKYDAGSFYSTQMHIHEKV
jgi:hypothetical protein